MNNVERIQREGKELLLSSGWSDKKIELLTQCLIDFTGQAFSDDMYQDAKLELYEDEHEQTLDIIWKTDRLNVRVVLFEEIAASWDLFAGKIVDGKEVETESSGAGGSKRFFEYEGHTSESDSWAFHFYWWLEDYLHPM